MGVSYTPKDIFTMEDAMVMQMREKMKAASEATDKSDEGDADEPATSGVGVIVIKDGKVLAGYRSESGEVCGPGGGIDTDETPAAAAIRETQEEFGITPLVLKPVGQMEGLAEQYGEPFMFICTDYDGVPTCNHLEMNDPFWLDLNDLPERLYPPFGESLKRLGSGEFTGFSGGNVLQNMDKYDIIEEGQDTSNMDSGDDIIYRKSKNNNTYALNTSTDIILGGLGPDLAGKQIRQYHGGKASSGGSKGTGRKWANATDRKAYNDKLIGMMTEADVPVEHIDKHAYNRAVERNVTPDEVVEALGKNKTQIQLPGDKKKGNAPTYQTGTVKVAFDPVTKTIKSIMKDSL